VGADGAATAGSCAPRTAGDRLAALRTYQPPPEPVTATDPALDARQAYVDILRAFADEVPDGRLTCTAYTHARASHPEWPTRNTLALAFGTWSRRCAAAGLGAAGQPVAPRSSPR
jgi:hypothetical protein